MSTQQQHPLFNQISDANDHSSAPITTKNGATIPTSSILHHSNDDLPSTLQRLSLSNLSHSTTANSSSQTSPDLVILKIKNIPNDLTLREAFLIFSLCIDDIHSVDIRQETQSPTNTNVISPVIYAKFISIKTATQVLQLLNNKLLFGSNYPPISCELTHDFNNKSNSLGELSSNPANDILSNFTNSFPQQQQQQQQQQQTRSRFPFDNSQPQKNQDVPSPTSPSLPKNLSLSLDNNFNSISRGFSSQRFDHQNQFQNGNTSWNTSATTTPSKVLRPDNLNLQPSSSQVIQNGSNLSTPLTDWSQSHFFNSNHQTPILINEHSTSTHQHQQHLRSHQQQLASTTVTTPTNSSNQQKPPNSNDTTTQSVQADLSLLARVPPPANPADQNPPCNTLYVGNLPPDATEIELRALFQPQAGFRRLSFRTKQNSNGVSHHGPMCFVEFEDVAHATRALAELYGRQLVRVNGNSISNKGGIRLSFSKNPLGVRGPTHQRRQQQQQQQQQQVQSPTTPTNSNNSTINNPIGGSASSGAGLNTINGNSGYGYFNNYQFNSNQSVAP